MAANFFDPNFVKYLIYQPRLTPAYYFNYNENYILDKQKRRAFGPPFSVWLDAPGRARP
jgi:hypothetical protein